MESSKAIDIAFVRFSAPDLALMEEYLLEFGMQTARRGADVLYMRGHGSSPYVHVTHLGPPKFLGVGFVVNSEQELEALARREGVAVKDLDGPGGGKAVELLDPDGFVVEVVAGRQATDQHKIPVAQLHSTFASRARANLVKRIGRGPSHVMRLGHCVLNVSNFATSEAWYKERLGFITSDEVEAAPGVAIGAFMRCDLGDVPTDHHTLFLAGLGKAAFNHAAFEVIDFDDLMRGSDHLKEAAREHDWGIGRHVLGSQIFDYWRDPWGHVLEHWTDGDQMNAQWGSRKAALPDLLGVQWGHTFADAHTPKPKSGATAG